MTSIHNAQHNKFLLGLMPPLDEKLEFGQRRIGENNNGFWIGLKLLGTRGNDGNTVFNYTWADSTPFDFGALPERDDEESVWIPSVNTKNIFDSVEQCVFLTSDGWNPTDCSGLFSSRVPGFIVTKPPVAKNASTNSSNSGRLECHWDNLNSMFKELLKSLETLQLDHFQQIKANKHSRFQHPVCKHSLKTRQKSAEMKSRQPCI